MDLTGMRAPTMRGEVKKKFGETFNGGLMYAKLDEMKAVLNGTMKPEVLARALKRRAKQRQTATGIMPGKKPNVMPQAIRGRRAASPIPPDARARRDANHNGKSVSTVLLIAAAMAEVGQFQAATPQTLHSAVDCLVAARGQA